MCCYRRTPAPIDGFSQAIPLTAMGGIPALTRLSLWFILLGITTLGRALLAYRYARARPPATAAYRWGRRYIIGAGLAGLAWGSAAVLLFPQNDLSHQVFVAFVLAGMTAAAVGALSAHCSEERLRLALQASEAGVWEWNLITDAIFWSPENLSLVRLPLGTATPSGQQTIAAPEHPGPGAPRRILVVDDHADVAESLALVLELEGHQVKIALDGPTALKLAPEFQPEAILLDLGLPGMDGYAVARQLRARPETRTVLLIAVTGYGRQEDRARTQAAGFDHHLVKPIDLEELKTLLAAGR